MTLQEIFEKMMLATKHPVYGYISEHWLRMVDTPSYVDNEGELKRATQRVYENDYVQGAWIGFYKGMQEAQKVCDSIASNSKDFSEFARKGAGVCSGILRHTLDDIGHKRSCELIEIQICKGNIKPFTGLLTSTLDYLEVRILVGQGAFNFLQAEALSMDESAVSFSGRTAKVEVVSAMDAYEILMEAYVSQGKEHTWQPMYKFKVV